MDEILHHLGALNYCNSWANDVRVLDTSVFFPSFAGCDDGIVLVSMFRFQKKQTAQEGPMPIPFILRATHEKNRASSQHGTLTRAQQRLLSS